MAELAETSAFACRLFKLWDLQDPVAPRFQVSSQVRSASRPPSAQMLAWLVLRTARCRTRCPTNARFALRMAAPTSVRSTTLLRFKCFSHLCLLQGVRDVKIAAGALLLLMEPGPERPDDLRLRVLDLVHGDCVQVRCCLQALEGLWRQAVPRRENDRWLMWASVLSPVLTILSLPRPSLQDLCLPMWMPDIPSNRLIGGGMEVVELLGLHLLTKQTGGPLFIRHILTGAVRCGADTMAALHAGV